MPVMGGFEATHLIRQYEEPLQDTTETETERVRYARVPIIAMAAHAIAGYREKCLEAGMTGFVSKPIQMKILKEIVETYVK